MTKTDEEKTTWMTWTMYPEQYGNLFLFQQKERTPLLSVSIEPFLGSDQ